MEKRKKDNSAAARLLEGKQEKTTAQPKKVNYT